MSSPVLFSTGATASSSSSRNLVEFRAGKMELKNKMVHPIKRQGLVYLHQSPDDSLMHFCWKDRQSGSIEDDLILFPDDCEFKRVPQCTTGRVYVLKMKSSNRKLFFWMQESRTDKDEEYCVKINDLLNNPPPPRPRHLPGDMGSADGDLQALLHNLTNEQMSQMLGSSLMPGGGRGSIPPGVGNLASLLSSARSPSTNSTSGTTGSGTTTGPTSAGSGNSMTDIQSILSSLTNRDLAEAAALASGQSVDGSVTDEARAASTTEGQQQQPPIDLSSVVNLSSLERLLSDKEFLNHIEQHLPNIRQLDGANSAQQTVPNEPVEKQFSDTVRSPQFKSALSQFSAALQSGQLGPLVAQFGLNEACVVAANHGNLEAFVQALEREQSSSDRKTSEEKKSPDEPSESSK